MNVFRKKRIRRMLRGYIRLKRGNSLERIMETQIALVEMPLGISQSKISKFLFGASTEKANEAIRDFLITRVGQYSLNKSLLESLGENKGQAIHPLPKIWREKIQSLGWEVSKIRSAVIWQGFLFLCFSYGGFLLAKSLLRGFWASILPNPISPGKHVYFSGLTKNNLPQRNVGDSYDIISWYLQWQGRQEGIQTIGHNIKDVQECKIEGVNIRFSDPLGPIRGIGSNGRLLAWGFGAACICLVDWLRGCWWSPLMFAPCLQSFIARQQPNYALDYLFHNSGPRKPLWLNEVEAMGGKTTFYFYSTNSDSFMTEGGYQPTPAYYRNMQWNRYLVWDQEQAEFVRRCVGNKAKIEIVGPIWNSESTAILPNLTSRTVAVFDIRPRRKSIYVVLGDSLEYYTPAIAIKFLNDIHEVAAQHNWTMAWKEKRGLPQKIAKHISKSYKSACRSLASCQNTLIIDPDLAAARLIEKSTLVISMPFTSTALIAKNLGVPSYYYDPSGIIQKGDRAAHSIPIISGVNELRSIFTIESTKNKYDQKDLYAKEIESVLVNANHFV